MINGGLQDFEFLVNTVAFRGLKSKPRLGRKGVTGEGLGAGTRSFDTCLAS